MRTAILLTLLILVAAASWGEDAKETAQPAMVEPAASAPSGPADLMPVPLLASSCEANVTCRPPWMGYLHCEGDSYCISSDTWIDCDGHVQYCECGLIPPEYCP